MIGELSCRWRLVAATSNHLLPLMERRPNGHPNKALAEDWADDFDSFDCYGLLNGRRSRLTYDS